MLRKGERVGPYTLLEKLGRGGFGVVWLAEKRTALTVTQVALKIPHDDEIELEAVRQEAALWVAASGHPNVLSIIDADIYDGLVVIVSEYAPDGSLEQWLKRNGRVSSARDAFEMMDGILAGLEHLHAKRIIHRDLKPANVLLQGRIPRLVDFGLARVLKSTSHSQTVSGTYAYMPPESFENKRSEQTDIWSAGVILYEMLTGTFPFPTDTDAALIGAILHRAPEPLPDLVDPRLRGVVECALRKELGRRFRTASAMRRALRSFGTESPIEVAPEAPRTVGPPLVVPVFSVEQPKESQPTAILVAVDPPAAAPEIDDVNGSEMEHDSGTYDPFRLQHWTPDAKYLPDPIPGNENVDLFPEDGDWWQTGIAPDPPVAATVSAESFVIRGVRDDRHSQPTVASPRESIGETVPALNAEMLKNVSSGASVGKVVIGALLALGFTVLVTWLVTQYFFD